MSAKQPLDQPTALIGSWPGLVLLAAAAVASLNLLTPLVTPRPKDGSPSDVPRPPTAARTKALYARLWEDPLGTVYRDARNGSAEDVPELPKWCWIPLLPAPLNCFLAETSLGQGDSFQRPRQHFKRVLESLASDRPGEQPTLLCLPILVSGGPYADDREQRMRTRYAVQAALAAHGYKLSFPKRLTYINIPLAIHVRTDGPRQFQPHELTVPIKLFVRDDVDFKKSNILPSGDSSSPDGVLVMWIDQDQLGGRPLTSLAQVLDICFPDDCSKEVSQARKVHLAVIGPADSDALLAMARENDRWCPAKSSRNQGAAEANGPTQSPCCQSDDLVRCIIRVHQGPFFSNRFCHPMLFSCRATVWADVLRQDSKRQIERLQHNSEPPTSGLRLFGMIGTDDQLAAALRRELGLRGAWPDNQNNGTIVLLTERDTLYGRAFPAVFAELLRSDKRSPADSLRVFKYLRGTEGQAVDRPGAEPEAPLDTANDTKKSNHQADLPSGPSQLDYLRRLQDQLVELRDRLYADGGRQILAVGVVGTDVFDKLLVLRALHKEFGQTLFFTTDMEAHYAHQNEYSFARNLIIASHYGLQLHPRLQGDAPPFRDSYQTATYLAVRRALAPKLFGGWRPDESSPWQWPRPASEVCAAPGQYPHCLQPLIYEVGRTGPYQLTITGGDERSDLAAGSPSITAAVQSLSPREYPWLAQRWGRLLIAVGLLLLALLLVARPIRKLLWPARVADRWLILAGLVLLLVCSLALGLAARRDHYDPDGEPVLLLEGISVWPVTLMRFLALVLAVSFVIDNSLKLRRNRREQIERDLLDLTENEQTGDASVGAPPAASTKSRFALWDKVQSFWDRLLFRDAWSIEPEREQSGLDTWKRYCYFGAFRRRFLRVAVASIVYFFACSRVFAAYATPNHDARGGLSRTLEQVVLYLAVASLIALTFFVIDEILLCKRLVRNLRSAKRWPVSAQRRLGRGVRYPAWIADELITARLVESRTNVSAMFLAGPFIVIVLLMVARSGLLEYSGFPLPLFFVIGLTAFGLFYAYIAQRLAAGHVRDVLVDRLLDRATMAAAGERTIEQEQCKSAVAEIRAMRRGAFRPWHQDPLWRAIAIPLGGAGGLALLNVFLSS